MRDKIKLVFFGRATGALLHDHEEQASASGQAGKPRNSIRSCASNVPYKESKIK